SWRTCCSVTFLPSQLRSTDSSTMRIDTGRREISTPSVSPNAGSEWNFPLRARPALKGRSVLKVLPDMTSPRFVSTGLWVLLVLFFCSWPRATLLTGLLPGVHQQRFGRRALFLQRRQLCRTAAFVGELPAFAGI